MQMGAMEATADEDAMQMVKVDQKKIFKQVHELTEGFEEKQMAMKLCL